MIKLLAALTILVGVWEVCKLFTISSRCKLLEEANKFSSKAKAGKVSKEDAVEIINVFITMILMLIPEVSEMLIIILGAVYFPAPLKWYVASLILASIVMGVIPKGLRKYACYVDNLYSAAVLIAGPLLLLK